MDISKCSGVGCKIRRTCWRYLASPNIHWQSYSDFWKDKPCEYYWAINPKKNLIYKQLEEIVKGKKKFK